ncbi:MAG: GNAT family N-acetyltransferase, partial [Pseudomonadota bacterium]
GGNRVSAASGSGPVAEAVDALAAWGQDPLFRLLPGQAALDAELEAQGYRMHEPTVFYAARADEMHGEQSHMAAAYRCHCRPAIMEEIWASGGIGPARLAIMERVTVPKQLLMSRADNSPAATAFAAIDGDVAMIHAIEVLLQYRRKGCAILILEAAARWASEQGAEWLTLAVTQANVGARALYERLGMVETGAYHYRIKTGESQ